MLVVWASLLNCGIAVQHCLLASTWIDVQHSPVQLSVQATNIVQLLIVLSGDSRWSDLHQLSIFAPKWFVDNSFDVAVDNLVCIAIVPLLEHLPVNGTSLVVIRSVLL